MSLQSIVELQTSTTALLKDLSSREGATLLSLAMPTHRKGHETKGDSIRLKNLVSSAETRMKQRNVDDKAIDSILGQIQEAISGSTFWQHQREGLLILASPDHCDLVSLTHQPAESIHLGEYFDVSNVVMDLSNRIDGRVLALTKKRACLYEASAEHCQPVECDQFPVTFDDLVLDRDPEKQLQYHSQNVGGRGVAGAKSPVYHGQGLGESKLETDVEAYYSRVLELLDEVTHDNESAITIFATEEVAGHVMARASFVPRDAIRGSIDGMVDQEVLQRIQTHFSDCETKHSEVLERFGTARANQTGATDLNQIQDAATQGRIDTLLVRKSLFVDGSDANIPYDECKPAVLDDIRATIIAAVRSGSQIEWFEGSDSAIGTAPIAAIYRY